MIISGFYQGSVPTLGNTYRRIMRLDEDAGEDISSLRLSNYGAITFWLASEETSFHNDGWTMKPGDTFTFTPPTNQSVSLHDIFVLVPNNETGSIRIEWIGFIRPSYITEIGNLPVAIQ